MFDQTFVFKILCNFLFHITFTINILYTEMDKNIYDIRIFIHMIIPIHGCKRYQILQQSIFLFLIRQCHFLLLLQILSAIFKLILTLT